MGIITPGLFTLFPPGLVMSFSTALIPSLAPAQSMTFLQSLCMPPSLSMM